MYFSKVPVGWSQSYKRAFLSLISSRVMGRIEKRSSGVRLLALSAPCGLFSTSVYGGFVWWAKWQNIFLHFQRNPFSPVCLWVCAGAWLLVSLCWPCDKVVTCPGCELLQHLHDPGWRWRSDRKWKNKWLDWIVDVWWNPGTFVIRICPFTRLDLLDKSL